MRKHDGRRRTDILRVVAGMACLAAFVGPGIAAEPARRPAVEGAERRTVDDPRRIDRLQELREGVGGGPSAASTDATAFDVQSIVDWLKSVQNPSGSWGSTYEFVDTATVVETLGRVQPAGQAFEDGAAWLTAQTAADHDQLSRKILALRYLPGYDLEPLTDELLASRNLAENDPAAPNYPEGGWGLGDGFETDALTTALALEALEAGGLEGGTQVVDETVAGGATNIHVWEIAQDAVKARIRITVSGATVRLRMTQGAPPTIFDPYFELPPGGPYLIVFPDSGLPFTPGTNYISIENPDGLAPTATYSFTASYETPDFDTRELAEALDYLRQAQNGDGGWGLQVGEATSFFTTLRVMMALQVYELYDFVDELGAGRTYVLGEQLLDGSFGYGGTPVPYVTALATLVLLRGDGCPLSVETEDALNGLQGLQDPDNSWAQEPYDTGLSLRALFEYDNDGDLLFADADCSGTPGDNPCPIGVTVGCDDNCADYSNPGQNEVVFGQTVTAPNRVSFVWDNPVDARFVRGDLALVDSYTYDEDGELLGATSLGTALDEPAAGTGLYYLLRLSGDCTVASWQTGVGAEPGRDAALP